MTACVGKGSIRRISRWGLSMLAVAALALCAASPSHAQTAAKAAGPKAAASATPAAKAGPSKGGNREGIKVHGHWVIEVKNPDGTVTARREFENSLVISGGLSDGAALLAGLLGRVVTPGGWVITLANTPSGLGGVVLITESNSDGNAYCNFEVPLLQGQGIPASCSHTLTLTGPSLGSQGIASGSLTGGTLTLNASGILPQGFGIGGPYVQTITFVATNMFVCASSDTPTACTTDPNYLPLPFSARTLDGVSGDPSAVPASPGQTVQATVTFSFQ